MTLTQANPIKKHYESLYHDYGQACQDTGFQGEEDPCRLLEDYDLRIYYEVSEGWSRICQVPHQDSFTYAVCVTTDDDGGFLEIYSGNGEVVGAGRTYMGLISWVSRSEIRQFAYTLEYPADLGSRIRQGS